MEWRLHPDSCRTSAALAHRYQSLGTGVQEQDCARCIAVRASSRVRISVSLDLSVEYFGLHCRIKWQKVLSSHRGISLEGFGAGTDACMICSSTRLLRLQHNKENPDNSFTTGLLTELQKPTRIRRARCWPIGLRRLCMGVCGMAKLPRTSLLEENLVYNHNDSTSRRC